MVLGLLSRVIAVGLLFTAVVTPAEASPQITTSPAIPASARATTKFDPTEATNAWLATVPAEKKRRSDAYFEGGYWLLLWDFLWTSGVLLGLLVTGASVRMRNVAAKATRHSALQAVFYWLQFATAFACLSFPLTMYEGFFREHQYGLSNQTFAAWIGDALIGFGLALILGGVALSILIVVVRRFRRTWHVWCAFVGVLFMVIAVAIAPVFIAPLFNTYKPLENKQVREAILSLARANGIPATDVYEVNASRQSNRVSANVSGFAGTERITLNDNLLQRVSAAGVMATMGHEMGHYVLHHVLNGLIFFGLLILVMFYGLRILLDASLCKWGPRWNILSADDLAVLPLALLILTAINFVLTPLENTFIRTQEYEADLYGLNTARQPDGEAEVDLLLGEYRKLDPSAIEEVVFFDHPSGRTRIYAAMRWKAENLCLFDAALPCSNRPTGVTAAPSGSSLPSGTPQ